MEKETITTEHGHVEATHGRIADHDLIGDKMGASHPEGSEYGALTEEELVIQKRLRRKIDTMIMPLVVLVYLLNYIDRNNYAAARLQGLEADLGMNQQQYQTGLSILFVGYIIAQVPSNLVLNYVGRPSWYLGFFIIAWGTVSAATAAVTSFGVLFYLSKWYTKSELNLRMSIFYSGSLISGAFGNLIAAGILNGLGHAHGLSPWQWLYIIEGTITIGVGIAVIFMLPDFPDTWKGLDPELKRVANRRLAIEAAEADVDEAGGMSQLKGFKLAMADPATYILALAYMCTTGAAGFQNFFPSLTRTLGYSNTVSLLLCAPPYIFITVWALVHSIFSDKLGNRFWFFIYPIPITIIGFVVFMATQNFGAKYFSLFLMVFIFTMNGTTYAWIANAIPRPPAKRAAAFAFINSIGNSASIWTPFTYAGPRYLEALGLNIGLQVVAAVCGVALRVLLTRRNARLERLENEDVELSEKDMARLRKTAEFEGIDIATARRLQKGYRYMI